MGTRRLESQRGPPPAVTPTCIPLGLQSLQGTTAGTLGTVTVWGSEGQMRSNRGQDLDSTFFCFLFFNSARQTSPPQKGSLQIQPRAPAFNPDVAPPPALIGGSPGHDLRDWLIFKLGRVKGRTVVKMAKIELHYPIKAEECILNGSQDLLVLTPLISFLYPLVL